MRNSRISLRLERKMSGAWTIGGTRRARRGAVATLALVITAALCGGLAASAGAAPLWLAPVNLSESGFTGESPQVAADAHGDVTAVWGRGGGGDYAVQTATRPAGGAWQVPVTLSEAGVDAGGAQVADDPEGEAVAVWDTFPMPPATAARTIQAAVRSTSTGIWSAPVTLATIGEPTGNPQVSVDSHGNAVAVWEEQPVNPGPQYIQASFRPAGGTWSAPVDISSGNVASRPHIVMDPEGNAIVTWLGFDSVQSAVRLASNGAWQQSVEVAAIDLTAGGSPGGPALAVDGLGDVVTAWSSTIGSGSNHVVQAATLPAGGTWQTPVDLSEAGVDAGSPDVALNPAGEAIVIWSAATNAVVGSKSAVVQAAVRPAGGAWQAAMDISEPGQEVDEPPFEPKAVVDPHGNAIAVWEGLDGEDRVIQSAVRPAGSGDWQAPVNLSASDVRANNTQIAIDAQGNAVSVWRLENGSESIIQAAGYDAGLMIDGLEIPKTGTVGKPVSFSSSPLAVWSALGATSWNFGDGAGANGTSTTHVYVAAGDYTVTLSSVDALGNASSASATIAISSAHATSATTVTPPVLTDAGLSNRRFRVGRRATAISARKTPVGTSFHFTLSATAKLQITIIRSTPGLRKGHICRAPSTKLARAHAKRCTRSLTVGVLTRASETRGADSISFSGRLGHRALSPGTYTAVLSATDAGGRSKPVTLTFVIDR
jgi:hypothetical protein